jgi:hypothetical protein
MGLPDVGGKPTAYNVGETATVVEVFGSGSSGKNIIEKHPEIKKVDQKWRDIDLLINGETKDIENSKFLFRLPNEKANTFNKRKVFFARGFKNPTQQILSLKSEFIYRQDIHRISQSKNTTLDLFVNSAARGEKSLQDVMKGKISPAYWSYGTVFIVIDKPPIKPLTLEDEQRDGMPYLSVLSAGQVVDFEWGSDGKLDWFRYCVDEVPPRNNPFAERGKMQKVYFTWTRQNMIVNDAKGMIISDRSINHNLGIVPVVMHAQFLTDSSKTIGRSTFFQSADNIVMANNHFNVANNEIFKYASSILLVDSDDFNEDKKAVQSESNPETGQHKMTFERDEHSDIMIISELDKNYPRYLTKDLKVVAEAWGKGTDYFNQAIDNEKVRFGMSQDQTRNESGIAKAYDSEDQNAMLAGGAQDMETIEREIVDIACKWLNQKNDMSIIYPRRFDIFSFNENMDGLKAIKDLAVGSETLVKEMKKKIARQFVTEPDLLTKINKEIDTAKDAPLLTDPNKSASQLTDALPTSPAGALNFEK